MIKKFTLESLTHLLHATRLFLGAVSTAMWPLSFKVGRQRLNRLKSLRAWSYKSSQRTITPEVPYIYTRFFPVGRSGRTTQMVTKDQEWSIAWKILIPRRVSGPNIKHNNLAHSPPITCDIWWHILHSGSHEEGHSPSKLEKSGRGVLRAHYAGKIHSKQIVASQKSSSMPLTMDTLQEDSQDPGPLYISSGSYPQAEPSVMK